MSTLGTPIVLAMQQISVQKELQADVEPAVLAVQQDLVVQSKCLQADVEPAST